MTRTSIRFASLILLYPIYLLEVYLVRTRLISNIYTVHGIHDGIIIFFMRCARSYAYRLAVKRHGGPASGIEAG